MSLACRPSRGPVVEQLVDPPIGGPVGGGQCPASLSMRVEAVDQVAAVAVQRRVLAASSGSISLSGAGRMHAAVLADGDHDVQRDTVRPRASRRNSMEMTGSRAREPPVLHPTGKVRSPPDIAMVPNKKLGPALFLEQKTGFLHPFQCLKPTKFGHRVFRVLRRDVALSWHTNIY